MAQKDIPDHACLLDRLLAERDALEGHTPPTAANANLALVQRATSARTEYEESLAAWYEKQYAQESLDMRASLVAQTAEVATGRVRAEAERDQTLADLKELQKECDGLQADRDALQRHLDKTQSRTEAALTLQESAVRERNQLREELQQVQQQAREATRRADLSESSCKKLTQERDKLTERCESLQAELAAALNQLRGQGMTGRCPEKCERKTLLEYMSVVSLGRSLAVCFFNPASTDNKANQKKDVPGIYANAYSLCVPDQSVYEGCRWLADAVAEEKSDWAEHHETIGNNGCCSWVRRNGSLWVGTAGCARGSKTAKQAAMLSKAVAYCSLLPGSEVAPVVQYLSPEYHEEFLQCVGLVRAELGHVTISAVLPSPQSWRDATNWLVDARAQARAWKSGEARDVPVHVLRWTQGNMNNSFKSESRSLFDTAQELWMHVHTHASPRIPCLDVVLDDDGSFWSLDNRRLGAFRLLQALRNEMILAPCRVHLLNDNDLLPRIAAAYHFEKKTENCGLGIDFSYSRPLWSRSASRSLSRSLGGSTSPVRGRSVSTGAHRHSYRMSRSPVSGPRVELEAVQLQ